MWPWRRSRGLLKLRAPRVEFLGPQDGPVERELMRAIGPVLAQEDVVRAAYLVRARYPEGPSEGVALAIDASGLELPALVAPIGALFAERFKRSEHLDILFLRSERIPDVRGVCPPFFERPPG